MCLAAAGGTVRENSSIVSVQNTVQQRFGRCLVDFGLRGILVKYSVKGKSLILDSLSGGDDGAGEFVNWVVFRRIENTVKFVSAGGVELTGFRESLQALVIDHFDYWPNAFLCELGSGSGSEGAIAQEDCSIVTLGELCSLSDGKRPNANSD